MEFATPRENLLKQLQAMQGIVEKKTTIPILANIVIDAKKDHLELLATDLEVGLRSRCPASVKSPGSVTLSARRLFDIVRHLPEAEVRLKADEGHWVAITCEKARFRMVGLPREDFPAIPEFDFSKGIGIERSLFLDLVGKVSFAITTDEGRYQLGGAQTILNKRHLTMVATDGHRLAYADGKLQKGATEKPIEMILPRKALLELSRIGEGEEEVILGHHENQAFFKVGDTVLSANLLSGKFPEYDRVIPEGNDKLLKLDCESFSDVVRRVALLSGERSRAVKFSLREGALEVSSSNPEVGEASEIVDVDYSGGGLEIGFNAKYVIEFLQSVGSGEVILALKDEATQCLLRPVGLEGRDYRYVVMPMRIS